MWRLPMALAAAVSLLAVGCTFHHSRQALTHTATTPPSSEARFVTEEDSGLLLLGLFLVADADHHAVLLERMRRRYNCARIHHAELEYYTDFWILVGFPIARITAICEPPESPSADAGSDQAPASEARATVPAPSGEDRGETAAPAEAPDGPGAEDGLAPATPADVAAPASEDEETDRPGDVDEPAPDEE